MSGSAWLTVQLAIGAALVLARLQPRATPLVALWRARGLLLLALVLPWLPWGPADPSGPLAPSVLPQAWDAGVERITAAAPAPGPLPGALRPGPAWLLLPGGVWLAWEVARAVRVLRGTRRLHRRGSVEVREGRVACSAWGPRGAIVVVPAGDRAQLRHVLAHEGAHQRHGDTRLAWVLLVLRAACWPNPAIHLWARHLATLEELAADDAAARGARVAYARFLFAEGQSALPRALPALGRSPLAQRIYAVLTPSPARPAALTALALLCSAGLLAALVPPATAASAPEPAAVVAAANRRDGPEDPFPLELSGPVAASLAHIQSSPDRATWTRRALERRETWAALVDGALRDAGLPAELAAVPIVESGYTNLGAAGAPDSVSYAPGIPGRGLWMFITTTARAYGLRVDEAVDERLDPRRETEAAVALLADLHDRYQSWPLALAGYNQGERVVDRALAARPGADAWTLIEAGLLNDYAAQVVASAIVLEAPALVGAAP